MVPFKFMVYLPGEDQYDPIDEIKKGTDYKTISGMELRQMLDEGRGIPEWFSYPEVAKELEVSRPPLTQRGLTIFFTGINLIKNKNLLIIIENFFYTILYCILGPLFFSSFCKFP